MDYVLIVRLINVFLSVLALMWLSHLMYRYIFRWDWKTHANWWALLAWVVLGLVVTLEGLIRDLSGGIRTISQTAALLFTIAALSTQGPLRSKSIFDRKDKNNGGYNRGS